jgi:hypothetical protein
MSAGVVNPCMTRVGRGRELCAIGTRPVVDELRGALNLALLPAQLVDKLAGQI